MPHCARPCMRCFVSRLLARLYPLGLCSAATAFGPSFATSFTSGCPEPGVQSDAAMLEKATQSHAHPGWVGLGWVARLVGGWKGYPTLVHSNVLQPFLPGFQPLLCAQIPHTARMPMTRKQLKTQSLVQGEVLLQSPSVHAQCRHSPD